MARPRKKCSNLATRPWRGCIVRTGRSAADVKECDWILIGHSHFDHLFGAETILANTNATMQQLAEKGLFSAETTIAISKFIMQDRSDRSDAQVTLQQQIKANGEAQAVDYLFTRGGI